MKTMLVLSAGVTAKAGMFQTVRTNEMAPAQRRPKRVIKHIPVPPLNCSTKHELSEEELSTGKVGCASSV
ncbi:hypothetical protein GCM10010971_06570 [Silvimonas amylolytica]|uniref:Secreted protein n=1 Tax=Silvimonas amylolytica TaxID=449663 RepID=A0ABQ2PGX0_9NEIS|nr:hypothetical protein GCM10010971_06570 [Silvimonas amylolytica]